jgi:hypothetical protein
MYIFDWNGEIWKAVNMRPGVSYRDRTTRELLEAYHNSGRVTGIQCDEYFFRQALRYAKETSGY